MDMEKCEKCTDKIDNRRYMHCVICKNKYHLSCANVSSPRYHLMTPERKEKWQCNPCWELKHQEIPGVEEQCVETPKSDFITKRNKYKVNVPTSNSFDTLSEEELSYISPMGSELNRSCPEPQINLTEKLEEMKGKNLTLENEVQAADEEIQNLLSENNMLKKKITQMELRIKTLEKICISPKIISTSKARKKSLGRKTINLCKEDQDEINQSFQNLNIPNILNKSTPILRNGIDNSKGKKETTNESAVSSQNKGEINRRLCLISSNSKNKILQIAENSLEYTNICHYVYPGHNVQQVLKGLENKLIDFTMNDYCILFIGDADFYVTSDYHKIVKCIRDTLMGLQHTNVIICLPTFKCTRYCKLFNQRIEMFNNSLYLDNCAHKYAYLLDSNKHLEYSLNMFNGKTGFIKNSGFKVIFSDLNRLIMDISEFIRLQDFDEQGNHRTSSSEAHMRQSLLKNNVTKNFFRP